MITLKDIKKTYITGTEKVEALKGVSISFRRSEFVSILGPSGGGKTTMLNIIGGLDHATDGDLVINGKSTKNFKDRDWDTYRNYKVGFVFQNYNLIPHQSILSNVELALTISGISRKERKDRAAKALGMVGLSDKLNKRPAELSGGQMQRVAIARALVNDPEIVLADEPTGALDSKTGTSIMEILKEISKDRLVVMVTHNPDLAYQYSTRIVTLSDGQLTSDSDPYTEEEEDESEKNTDWERSHRTSMKLTTAFALSLNNLRTKKGRTFLTAFAGSIGIIGIALILSLSNGVNNYIQNIQEETMSSYPLQIRTRSADYTSMIAGMMEARNSRGEPGENIVQEIQIINDMFANISSNDLTAFKHYLEDHPEEVGQNTACIQYSYNVNPQIYLPDTSKGVTALSASRNAYSTSGGSSSFQQITNEDLLSTSYEMLAGRWPRSYDEAVIVLSSAHTIADFTSYSIGLKDQSEFQKMMQQAMAGEPVEVSSQPVEYAYEDLLKLEYKVIPQYTYYRYNAEYGVYEDMRSDTEYMKRIVDQGITLKVVGIISPTSSMGTSTLFPGVGYTSDLIDYLINQAERSDVVQKQLGDPLVDVFTDRTFEEEQDEQADQQAMDMNSIISIDQNKLAQAFSSDVDMSEVSAVISRSITGILNGLTADTRPAMEDIKGLIDTMVKDVTGPLIEAEEDGSVMVSLKDLEDAVTAYIEKEETIASMDAVAAKYSLPAGTLQPILKQVFTMMFQSEYLQDVEEIPLTREMVDLVLQVYAEIPQIRDGLNQLAVTLTETKMKIDTAAAIASMTSTIMQNLSSAFNVDTSLIAEAFRINMTEEELMRLMTTYSNASTREYTYEENLGRLGFADTEQPSGIDIYFRDFDSKERFNDFVKRYNDNMVDQGRDDETIATTDIAATLISSVKQIVDIISYVLIAFVSVSLIVSSIMIGIITYISVLERIKEIGLLRAIGASKKDISHVFDAETFSIGLFSGLIGVAATWLICIPLTAWLRNLSGIPDLVVGLSWQAAVILVVISVTLTLIAGLMPASMAARQDPIKALRTE